MDELKEIYDIFIEHYKSLIETISFKNGEIVSFVYQGIKIYGIIERHDIDYNENKFGYDIGYHVKVKTRKWFKGKFQTFFNYWTVPPLEIHRENELKENVEWEKTWLPFGKEYPKDL